MAQPQIKQVPERWITSDTGRQVIYIILAATLAVLAAIGVITAEQGESILLSIVNGAGALGFVLAAGNKPQPASPELGG